MMRLPGHPSLRRPLQASTSFVLALARCARCTLTPAAVLALTGTYPGTGQHGEPGSGAAANAGMPQPCPQSATSSLSYRA
jgi:hypothetical protein